MSIKPRKAARRPRSATPKKQSVWRSCLTALPITLGAGLLLLLLCTAILLATEDPNRFSGAVGIAVLCITALIGGAVITRLHGRRSALLCGLAEGVALFLVLTVPALFLSSEGGVMAGLLTRCLVIPCAIAGALWSARQKKEPKRHRRAAHR